MFHPSFATKLLTILSFPFVAGCSNFFELARNLDFMDQTATVSGQITNVSEHPNVWVSVIEWDRERNEVAAADFTKAEGIGVFGFFVKNSKNQYLCAFSDRNGNESYEPGEPAWVHSDVSGQPTPLVFDGNKLRDVDGSLSRSVQLPEQMLSDAKKWADGRDPDEIKTGWNIPVGLGEVVSLDEPRFSAEAGQKGYWKPGSFPLETGVGIYFLEKYDPNRTPVIFVFGAAGSPQDWRSFFNKFDRSRFQLWFYEYPTGRRLDEVGGAFNHGIQTLQAHFGFKHLNIVAHSMGGLMSRYAILENLSDGNRYIDHFVSIASPFGGIDSSKMGVKHAPSVIPSWRDLVPDSDFQQEIFSSKLKGRVDYMLLYGDKSKRSLTLSGKNDGTVSVASATQAAAVADATVVKSFDEDHTSILSNPDVIRLVEEFLSD